MTEKRILTTKKVSHWILFVLCMLLSINLFVQFSNQLWQQILFALLAFAFELMKLYVLILAKDKFSQFVDHIKKKLKDKISLVLMGFSQFVIYLGFALISILASIGFTLTNIQEQTFIASTDNEKIVTIEIEMKQLDRKIELIEKQIETKTEQMTSIESSRGTQSSGFTGQIDALMQEQNQLFRRRKELINKRSTLQNEKTIAIEKIEIKETEDQTKEERKELREQRIQEVSQKYDQDLTVVNSQIQEIDKAIYQVEAQIKDKNSQMGNLDSSFDQMDTLAFQIDDLTQEQIDLLGRRGELVKEKQEAAKDIKTEASDIFSLLGSKVGLSGEDTMLYMLLVLVFLLEVSIALTSDKLERIKPIKDLQVKGDINFKEVESKIQDPAKPLVHKKVKIWDYIEELYNTTDGYLKSDEEISEKLGVSLSSCRTYRKALSSMKWKGRVLISNNKANFNKEILKKIIRLHIENKQHQK